MLTAFRVRWIGVLPDWVGVKLQCNTSGAAVADGAIHVVAAQVEFESKA